MQIDQPSCSRIERPTLIMFLVVFLLLYPTSASDFSLSAGSNRTISSDAIVFAAEAEAEEASGQHLGTTEAIPSSFSPPSPPYIYPRATRYD